MISDPSMKGIFLMITAMAFFAIADTLIKLAAGSMSPAHTILMLIAGAAIIFTALAWLQGERLRQPGAFAPILLLRYTVEIIGTFSMVMALSAVPLSTIGAIMQATPLLVVLGAVLFLGEQVSWRRWSAIGVGFLGVLMIVRPTGAAFDVNVIWAIVAMVGLSARDLTTRMTPPGMSTARLITYTMYAATPFAVIWCLVAEETLLPVDADWMLIVGMTSFGALGYLLVTASMRLGDVSVVSPYRYTRLLFMLLFGIVVFAERPDIWTLAGAALILASGIYTMWRDRTLARERARQRPA